MKRNLVIATAAIAVVLSGCNKKAEGQTVAVVNGEEITAVELNNELAAAKIPEGTDKDQARSRLLQAMVDRLLLTQQARKDGIDKTPDYLNQQRRMNDELLIKMLASRQIDTAPLPTDREIQQFQAGHPEIFAKREKWGLDQIRFEMPTDSTTKGKIAASKSLDELISVLTERKIGFTRGKNQLDTAVIPHAIYGRIVTMQPGEPFIIPVGNMAVASVITSREAAPLPLEQMKPVAVAGIRRTQSAKLMQDRLASLRQSAKIEYKAGFAPPKK